MASGYLEKRRDEVIELLTEKFATNVITTEEYEQRVSLANQVSDVSELESLVREFVAEREYSQVPSMTSQYISCYLGSRRYEGSWLEGSRLEARVIMGSAILDLRRQRLSSNTRIDLQVIMGEVKILVPRGVQVDIQVNPILGEVDRRDARRTIRRQIKGVLNNILGASGEDFGPEIPHGARLTVTGSAIMGSVTIVEFEED